MFKDIKTSWFGINEFIALGIQTGSIWLGKVKNKRHSSIKDDVMTMMLLDGDHADQGISLASCSEVHQNPDTTALFHDILNG